MGRGYLRAPPTVTLLPLRDWRCFNPLHSRAAAAAAALRGARTEAWSLSTEHRCAKPLEYPCAGEARTDHPGGLSLSDRQKGKRRGESMAVEEEGLRIFQSVKIKIGKKENNTPPPQTPSSLSASTDGCVLTGRAGRQAVRAGGWRASRLLTAVVYNSNHTFFFYPPFFPSAQSRRTASCKIINAKNGQSRHIGSRVGKLWEFGSWFKKPVSGFELWGNPNRLSVWTPPQLHGSRWLLPFFRIEFNYLNLYYTGIAVTHSYNNPPSLSPTPLKNSFMPTV